MADEKQPLSEPNGSSGSGWSAERLDKFWAAMVGLYGQRWVREWGSTLPPVWERELSSMTPDEAALGWKACRDSGDREPCTLAQFLRRVSDALKTNKRPETYKPLPQPASRVVPDLFKSAVKARDEAADRVDVPRLARAPGVKASQVRCRWPRRTVLRGQVHPAGQFDLEALWKAKGQAKQQGRSIYDLELELMAYNGWTPDDEAGYGGMLATCGKGSGVDSGTTPFLDAWKAAAQSDD